MGQLFSNNAVTTLAAGISASATELTVAPGKGDNFPVVVGGVGDFFIATLEDAAGNREFIRVDVRGAASDTLGSATFPLQRGHFGTTARSWLLGDTVDLRFTAEAMNGLLTPEQSIIPGTTGVYDIASPTFRYRDLFLSRDANIEGALTVLGGAGIVGNSSIAGDLNLTGTGSITLLGTVDGRDVAADGTKLDGIEAGATADQTNAEIETAYNAQVAAATQLEMETGTEPGIRRVSPLRVAQAIAALGSAANSGLNNEILISDGLAGFKTDTTFLYDTSANFLTAANALFTVTQNPGFRVRSTTGAMVAEIDSFTNSEYSLWFRENGNDRFRIFANNNANEHTDIMKYSATGIVESVMRFETDGGLQYWDGNLATLLLDIDPAAEVMVLRSRLDLSTGTNAGQIKFPAVAVPSTDPNTLDDFEQTEFVTQMSTTGTGSFSMNAGANELVYTKVGRQVFVNGQITISSPQSPTGNLAVDLPFNVANLNDTAERGGGICFGENVNGTGTDDYIMFVFTAAGNSIATFRKYDGTTIAANTVAAGASFTFAFSYYTD